MRSKSDHRRAGCDFRPLRTVQQTCNGAWHFGIVRTGKRDGALCAPGSCVWWPQRSKPANSEQALTHDDLSHGLIFLGIAGMMDPPRPEAIDA